MTGESGFQIRRGVLQFHRPPESGDLLFLCWPVLAYRVTAPVLRVRHLNIIEKVILALCQAGIREPDTLSAKIRQSPELCEHVIRQLRDVGRIDRYGAPTELGKDTLATNRIGEEPDLIVTHVFQDPWTGRLWPRAAEDLVFQRVNGIRDGEAELRLNTAGSPRPVTAGIVTPGSVTTRPPAPQQIIDAVAAHQRAELARRAERLTERRDGRSPTAYSVERDLESLSTELTLPHETAVHRVLDVGSPMSEYILVWAYKGDGSGMRDPFGLDPNPMLQRLVAERRRADSRLAEAVAKSDDTAVARAAEEYRTSGAALMRAVEERYVHLLGPEVRQRPEMWDLLLGLDEAAARGGKSGLEQVARDAYRLYESLFRRLVAEYPPPDRPSWDAGSRAASAGSVRSALETAADDLGIDRPPGQYLAKQSGKLRKYPERIRSGGSVADLDRAFVNDLFPYVLVAAADPNGPHRLSHPIRELTNRRPTLYADLQELGELRNRGSHAERDATVEEDIDWCRELGLDAARLVISMPPPTPERN